MCSQRRYFFHVISCRGYIVIQSVDISSEFPSHSVPIQGSQRPHTQNVRDSPVCAVRQGLTLSLALSVSPSLSRSVDWMKQARL